MSILKGRKNVRLQEVHWQYFVGVVPYYQNNGRTGSIIYYEDGSCDFVQARCERVLKELALYLNTTLELVMERTERLTRGKYKRRKALVMDETMSVVPLKCREERSRNSGTLGYIAVNKIYHVHIMPDESTWLLLHAEHSGIHVAQKWPTVMRQIDIGRELLRLYQEQLAERRQQQTEGMHKGQEEP